MCRQCVRWTHVAGEGAQCSGSVERVSGIERVLSVSSTGRQHSVGDPLFFASMDFGLGYFTLFW